MFQIHEGAERAFRVVVVDDEGIIASTAAIILKQAGYLAEAFTCPDAALASCRIQLPDLLLTEIVMPQMSGVQLAIEVSKLAPACKVMLFTGHTNIPVLLEEASRHGLHFDVYPKPLHPKAMLKRVGELLKS